MKVSALELALLGNIVHREYQSHSTPVDHAVWGGAMYLDGNGITARNIAGVTTSLVKKGLVIASDYDRHHDPTIAITELGYDIYRVHQHKEKTMTKNATANSTKRAKTDPGKAKKDDGLISVADVAREEGADPKVVRAKLRRMGKESNEGRWPRMQRGSEKHKQLVAIIHGDKE